MMTIYKPISNVIKQDLRDIFYYPLSFDAQRTLGKIFSRFCREYNYAYERNNHVKKANLYSEYAISSFHNYIKNNLQWVLNNYPILKSPVELKSRDIIISKTPNEDVICSFYSYNIHDAIKKAYEAGFCMGRASLDLTRALAAIKQ